MLVVTLVVNDEVRLVEVVIEDVGEDVTLVVGE